MDRYKVASPQAFGELIKAWSRGTINPPTKDDLDELRRQANEMGVGLVIPDHITKLAIIHQEEDTIKILVPLSAMINESEQEISRPGADYPLPSFYRTLAFHVPMNIAEQDKIKFHSSRVGDYSSGQCG